MEIILAPSDVAIIWKKMQGEEKDDAEQKPDNKIKELNKKEGHC